MKRRCWLAEHGVYVPTAHRGPEPMPPCDGRLRKCHLLAQQVIKRAGGDPWDERSWVWGCGGPTGIGGHHGMLDYSRTLRVPFAALPAETLELADELALRWRLEREYLKAAA